ncbi:hypothetical protein DRP07_10875, partial [Archaeoglobales archaeon]
ECFQYPFSGFLLFFDRIRNRNNKNRIYLSISIFRISAFLLPASSLIHLSISLFQYPFSGFLLFFTTLNSLIKFKLVSYIFF